MTLMRDKLNFSSLHYDNETQTNGYKDCQMVSQRIQFDVSPLRPDLVGSANTDGSLAFWELSKISSDAASAGPVQPHR